MNKPSLGWIFLSILTGGSILPALSYPSLSEHSHLAPHIVLPGQPQLVLPEARKFAEKPNATKKVQPVEDRNDLDDVQTNNISQDAGGFSWSNVLSMVMQLLFNPAGAAGPSKSDIMDTEQPSLTQSPWTNLLSVGFKILTAFLGGNADNNIDKVDNGNSSPMQFINIVVTLLDALKTSFSHRSMAARSLGKKDSISDAAIAGITFFKGYVRTMRAHNDGCVRKIICEASKECADDLSQPNGVYCQLGTYATTALLQKTTSTPYESLQEAGRRGRSAQTKDECKQIYTCSE